MTVRYLQHFGFVGFLGSLINVYLDENFKNKFSMTSYEVIAQIFIFSPLILQ